MYNLLQQYDVSIPSEALVLHEDLHERQQEYRSEIEVSQAFRDNKLTEMVSTVEANIVKLQDQVAAVVSRLDDQVMIFFHMKIKLLLCVMMMLFDYRCLLGRRCLKMLEKFWKI